MGWKKALDLFVEQLEKEKRARVTAIDPRSETVTAEVRGWVNTPWGTAMRAWELSVTFSIKHWLASGKLAEVVEVTTPGDAYLLNTGGKYREWIRWQFNPTEGWIGTVETSSEFAEEMGYPFKKGPISTEELLSRIKEYLSKPNYEVFIELFGGTIRLKAYTPPR